MPEISDKLRSVICGCTAWTSPGLDFSYGFLLRSASPTSESGNSGREGNSSPKCVEISADFALIFTPSHPTILLQRCKMVRYKELNWIVSMSHLPLILS